MTTDHELPDHTAGKPTRALQPVNAEILENTKANADTHEWQHRVRKLARDGKITTVLTMPQDTR